MPFKQHHRGRHPEDDRLFRDDRIPVLREAVANLSFLLSRNYSDVSALKLVGDRYQLSARHRRAVSAAACSDASLNHRAGAAVPAREMEHRAVCIDGYNLLITVESILAGGLLFKGRDGCIRDLASVHGSYRKVEETHPAVHLIGQALAGLTVPHATWYLDAPVSNSGRLRALLHEDAEASGWDWTVELVNGTDRALADAEEVIITSDGWILNRARAWTNLAETILQTVPRPTRLINLGSR